MVNDKLKELREEHGFTQQDVADALHISQNAYCLMENGKTKVDVARLLQFAEFYKIEPIELLSKVEGVTMNFNAKVENGYAENIEVLNAESKEFIIHLKQQLEVKDKQIEQLILQINSSKKIV